MSEAFKPEPIDFSRFSDRRIRDLDDGSIEVGLYEGESTLHVVGSMATGIAMELREFDDEEAARRMPGGDLHEAPVMPALPAWAQFFAAKDAAHLHDIENRVGREAVEELRRGQINF